MSDAQATVTVIVAASGQAVPPTVYVISAVPAKTPVTTPVEASTVATLASLVVHSPPVVPSEDIVVVPPGATVCVPVNVPAVGLLTVATTSAVPVHPTELVTTTVYVSVVEFDATGEVLVASSKPEVGVHAYV
jgi:hypothetical protein